MSGTALPAIGIAYALIAIFCGAGAIFKKNDKLWRSLAYLVLSIGVLNACAEQPAAMKGHPFTWAAAILLVLFASSYRSVCRRLIERTGLRPGFVAEQYAFLPLVYIGCAAMFFVVTLHSGQDENLPLALFAFVAFLCAVHVPGFAYGTSRVKEFMSRSGIVTPQSRVSITWRVIAAFAGLLVAPVILALLLQAIPFGDYRLASVDAVMAVVILSLLMIAKSKL